MPRVEGGQGPGSRTTSASGPPLGGRETGVAGRPTTPVRPWSREVSRAQTASTIIMVTATASATRAAPNPRFQ